MINKYLVVIKFQSVQVSKVWIKCRQSREREHTNIEREETTWFVSDQVRITSACSVHALHEMHATHAPFLPHRDSNNDLTFAIESISVPTDGNDKHFIHSFVIQISYARTGPRLDHPVSPPAGYLWLFSERASNCNQQQQLKCMCLISTCPDSFIHTLNGHHFGRPNCVRQLSSLRPTAFIACQSKIISFHPQNGHHCRSQRNRKWSSLIIHSQKGDLFVRCRRHFDQSSSTDRAADGRNTGEIETKGHNRSGQWIGHCKGCR